MVTQLTKKGKRRIKFKAGVDTALLKTQIELQQKRSITKSKILKKSFGKEITKIKSLRRDLKVFV